MSARWTRGKIDRHNLGLRWEAERKAAVVRARDASHARILVKVWNSRQARGAMPLFYPPIGAAILAGHSYLSFICPGRETVGEIDLRKIAGAADRPIYALITALKCQRCPSNPPLVKLRMLSAEPTMKLPWRRRR